MTATNSIERRVIRYVIGSVLLTLLATIAGISVVNTLFEESLLTRQMQEERSFIMGNINPDEPYTWNTATVQGFYVPDSMQAETETPEIFRSREFPFSGEAEVGEKKFMLENVPVNGGRLYIAKDISIYERQDVAYKRVLVVIGLMLLGLAVPLVRITSRHLVTPLVYLMRQIKSIEPAPSMPRLSEDGVDQELLVVVRSLNRFLDEMETYVKREKMLLGMASHELRTPISIIAGALDGIECRGETPAADARAMLRIRRAVSGMGASVQAILSLMSHGDLASDRVAPLLLVQEEMKDVDHIHHRARERVRLHESADPILLADPVLVRMLLRNLIDNALQHTTGALDVIIEATWIEFRDEGPGLPERYHSALTARPIVPTTTAAGLGLFIATLICERLQWQLKLIDTGPDGTVLRVIFGTASAAAAANNECEQPRTTVATQ
ncbi:HAMP domain-containing histidine kinase [Desulfurispirillum indicum]|uniref:sensor histidine kinase n=1 Tax=Desulfurispirillum indicum TaxID=936456 RepID=UPI001CFBF9B8|nr:HAMP domain-containing sensor histidine kinase [Desulfurispirillum indicum]UCZ56382.1 HAMP domain-containing histidine kinase [Desulfurispirillum indicum]